MPTLKSTFFNSIWLLNLKEYRTGCTLHPRYPSDINCMARHTSCSSPQSSCSARTQSSISVHIIMTKFILVIYYTPTGFSLDTFTFSPSRRGRGFSFLINSTTVSLFTLDAALTSSILECYGRTLRLGTITHTFFIHLLLSVSILLPPILYSL